MIINNIDFVVSETHPLLHLSETDKAYIAGLVDGEGCIRLPHNPNHRVRSDTRFQISMVHYPIILWLYQTIGSLGSFKREESVSRYNSNWRAQTSLVLS